MSVNKFEACDKLRDLYESHGLEQILEIINSDKDIFGRTSNCQNSRKEEMFMCLVCYRDLQKNLEGNHIEKNNILDYMSDILSNKQRKFIIITSSYPAHRRSEKHQKLMKESNMTEHDFNKHCKVTIGFYWKNKVVKRGRRNRDKIESQSGVNQEEIRDKFQKFYEEKEKEREEQTVQLIEQYNQEMKKQLLQFDERISRFSIIENSHLRNSCACSRVYEKSQISVPNSPNMQSDDLDNSNLPFSSELQEEHVTQLEKLNGRKLLICQNWFIRECFDPNCRFAHGLSELRLLNNQPLYKVIPQEQENKNKPDESDSDSD